MNKEQKEALLQKIWSRRNPFHEPNASTGKDMFWGTLLMVIEDFNAAAVEEEAARLAAEVSALREEVAEGRGGGWISVSEQLPEPYTEVLAWLKFKECCDVVVYKHGIWYSENYDQVGVTHWQPLPQPPKP